jgi:hypothetical protein
MLRYGFFLIVILYYVRETFILMENPKFVGVVVVDEISITSDLYFNATLLQFEGFADHLCDLPQGNNDEQFQDLATNETPYADHALVLMFRPFVGSWVQPIAVFSAKNALPGAALHKIIRERIVLLENAGAKVMAVVGDGAQTNKTMWRLFGLPGKNNQHFKNFIMNPMDPERPIFFIWDPPHVFKCIRNNWFTHKVAQV